MNIELGNLPIGSYREATKEELDELKKQISEKAEKRQETDFYKGKKPVKNAGKYRNPSKVRRQERQEASKNG